MFTNKLACHLTKIKNKCKDMQNVEWKHLLYTKPNLRTYVKFKEHICTEDYVKHCTSRRKRSAQSCCMFFMNTTSKLRVMIIYEDHP